MWQRRGFIREKKTIKGIGVGRVAVRGRYLTQFMGVEALLRSDSEPFSLGLTERWEQLHPHTKLSPEVVKDKAVIFVDLLKKDLQACHLFNNPEHLLRKSVWGGFRPVPDIHQVCIEHSLLHFQKVLFCFRFEPSVLHTLFGHTQHCWLLLTTNYSHALAA